MDVDDKLEKILEEIKEIVKVQAVQEQKLREINHRMGDGQQRNVLSHEMLSRKFDQLEIAVEKKVDIDDYKRAFDEMRQALAKSNKTLIIIAGILATGFSLAGNAEAIKRLLMAIFGMH